MVKKMFGKLLPLLLVVCILLSTTAFAANTYYIEVTITGPDVDGVTQTLTDVSSKYGSLSTPLAAEVVQIINDEIDLIRETYFGTGLGPIVYEGLEAFATGENAWKEYHNQHFDEVTGGFKEILSDMDSTFADLTVDEANRISYLTKSNTVYVVTVTLKEYDLSGGHHSSKDESEPKDDADCGEGVCPAAGLADVDLKAWYHDGIHYCVENGLMEGYSKNLFGTNDNLTRAQVAQILYNLMGKPAVEQKALFADVAVSAWYADAITWASEAGVVKGYGNDKFGPQDPITREQLAAMLYRYSESNGYDVSAAADVSTFADAGMISAWALRAVQWACAEGILTGMGNGTLNPTGFATRAQAATMFMRYCQNIAG